MAGHISDLMEALRGEVDRITTHQASEDKREELTDLLLKSIHQTLIEIKMGARSEEFQELTVLNFVVSADEAGYSTEIIGEFVKELQAVKSNRKKSRP